jgi:hypothetical protein
MGTATGTAMRQENKKTKPSTRNSFNSYTRAIDDIPTIFEIPLSTDQKPNHEGEMERILEAGGKVARIMDETGKRVGPYRVWNAMGYMPGLAMSRSIGDTVAHSVGVIAVPIVETFAFDPHDKFIVIASDGLWDVMENKDAVNLAEHFRAKCTRDTSEKLLSAHVKPADVNIANLLALEARYRWFDVVQEEDVMIDDISVIVIEIEGLPATSTPQPDPAQRMSISKASMLNVQEVQHAFMSSGSNPKRSDPVRGSHASIPVLRHSVSRNDKVRGSVVLNEEEQGMIEETAEEIRQSSKRH